MNGTLFTTNFKPNLRARQNAFAKGCYPKVARAFSREAIPLNFDL